jgi:hypothetical protein
VLSRGIGQQLDVTRVLLAEEQDAGFIGLLTQASPPDQSQQQFSPGLKLPALARRR